MFEHFKFKQLEGLEAEQTQVIISRAKKEAYQAPSYWIKNVLAFLLAVVCGIFLMQLPRLLNMDQTILGLLVQGSGILISVIFYQNLVKQIFLKYLVNQVSKT